jgi:hypothetical protein
MTLTTLRFEGVEMEPLFFYGTAFGVIAGWFAMSGLRSLRRWRRSRIGKREFQITKREQNLKIREQALQQFEAEHGILSEREARITDLGQKAQIVAMVLGAEQQAMEDDTVISLLEFDGPLAREIDDTVMLPPVEEDR